MRLRSNEKRAPATIRTPATEFLVISSYFITPTWTLRKREGEAP